MKPNDTVLKEALLILCISFFTCIQISAQFFGPAVQGTVTDEQNQPMHGLSVYEASNIGNGVITDLNGNYSIDITRGNNSILVFEFTGYDTQRIEYKGRQTINVPMVESKFNPNE